MMIFSMHITGNGTANCNEFSAGRNRKKPSGGHNYFQDLIQCNTTLAFKYSILFIK